MTEKGQLEERIVGFFCGDCCFGAVAGSVEHEQFHAGHVDYFPEKYIQLFSF